MRGHIRQRYPGSWSLVIDMGQNHDPATGKTSRRQQWFTFRGTKKQAEQKLTELLNRHHQGEVVEPSKLPFGEVLERWLETAVRERLALRTYETYRSIIRKHLVPQLGRYRLGELRPDHIEAYYAQSTLNHKTLESHHIVLSQALKVAVHHKLLRDNPAKLVMNKPKPRERSEGVAEQCWEPEEARAFLKAALEAGPQAAALYRLALETGCRKGEVCGLRWDNIDWEARTLTITQQLVKRWPVPVFGPPKNKKPRKIDLSPELLAVLRKQKSSQAQVRLLAGSSYQDFGLMFAYEKPPFGMPLSANNLGQREFAKLIKAAQVRPISFHGMRHTTATLMLKEGIPLKVVQERLGHKKASITLDIYSHALPSMQKEAAAKLSSMFGEAATC